MLATSQCSWEAAAMTLCCSSAGWVSSSLRMWMLRGLSKDPVANHPKWQESIMVSGSTAGWVFFRGGMASRKIMWSIWPGFNFEVEGQTGWGFDALGTLALSASSCFWSSCQKIGSDLWRNVAKLSEGVDDHVCKQSLISNSISSLGLLPSSFTCSRWRAPTIKLPALQEREGNGSILPTLQFTKPQMLRESTRFVQLIPPTVTIRQSMQEKLATWIQKCLFRWFRAPPTCGKRTPHEFLAETISQFVGNLMKFVGGILNPNTVYRQEYLGPYVEIRLRFFFNKILIFY